MKQVWIQIQPWNKDLAIAAIESGADAVVVDNGISSEVKALGRIKTVAEDGDIVMGRDALWMDVRSKEDEKRAAAMSRDILLLLRMADWTVIPIENLLAQRERLMAEVTTADQARMMIGILEKGVDGVVLNTRDSNTVRSVVQLIHGLSPAVSLQPAVVKRIELSGMGDRVCIDTCANMTVGEGMLVGNSSSAFFLVHSETLENPYVASRPFRVNASAVHAYILLPANRTAYLSDLRIGDEVMIVNFRGETQMTNIGRCKIEKRPMALVFAEAENREISVYLQNAETINLVTPEGKPISITRLKAGDRVLAHLERGGRHFGMKIDETLNEK